MSGYCSIAFRSVGAAFCDGRSPFSTASASSYRAEAYRSRAALIELPSRSCAATVVAAPITNRAIRNFFIPAPCAEDSPKGLAYVVLEHSPEGLAYFPITAPLYFMSMLTRTGVPGVTDTACRFSPSCGWRKRISCAPIETVRLPIGVSPTRCPSMNTSAHGVALM